MNTATARRLDKLSEEGVQIDTSTHAGRSKIGYNYLELVDDESDEND
jgi:biotin operon repressor